MNTRYLVDLQLFPCISFFKILLDRTNVDVCLYDRFRKMSFHNRYVVAGANGIVQLTVPVVGGREQKQLLTEVEVDYTSGWQKKHWRTLVSSYARAPFFDYYAGEIKSLLFTQEKKLSILNILILEKLCKLLNISVEIKYSYNFEYLAERDLRNDLLPRNFQSEGLRWEPKYPQVFEDRIGFQPNLSILDLLFNAGPASGLLMKGGTI